VHAACPNARLWIAGEGDAAFVAELRRSAEAESIGDAVRWLGMRRDMPALLDAADAFVLSSAWEGMPLVVGEAMAMGKPVVATDVGGVRELVGDSGTIVPAKNAEHLAEVMLAVMRQPREACEALGRAARLRIAEQFSIDAKADEWEAMYRTVLERKP
jgi:glycosyltransferase involved in cell wall biosynthesis